MNVQWHVINVLVQNFGYERAFCFEESVKIIRIVCGNVHFSYHLTARLSNSVPRQTVDKRIATFASIDGIKHRQRHVATADWAMRFLPTG